MGHEQDENSTLSSYETFSNYLTTPNFPFRLPQINEFVCVIGKDNFSRTAFLNPSRSTIKTTCNLNKITYAIRTSVNSLLNDHFKFNATRKT